MNLGELIEQFRIDCDDTNEPYLWADETVTRWLNEAEEEACRRCDLIIDSSHPTITMLSVNANDAWVPYDNRIVDIRRARPVGVLPVQVVSAEFMDTEFYAPNWEDETGPQLRALIKNMENLKLRTYPILTAALDISLTVKRIPLRPMSEAKHCPEILAKHHLKLIYWAQHKAYSVDDVDANDPRKASDYLAKFEREFGTMTTREEIWFQQNSGRDLLTGEFG